MSEELKENHIKSIQDAVREEISSYTNKGMLTGDAVKRLTELYQKEIASPGSDSLKKAEYEYGLKFLSA